MKAGKTADVRFHVPTFWKKPQSSTACHPAASASWPLDRFGFVNIGRANCLATTISISPVRVRRFVAHARVLRAHRRTLPLSKGYAAKAAVLAHGAGWTVAD
jgi:hypothetical protein